VSKEPERAALIMAAGKSTRMKSLLPKAAHPLCGRPIARHVVDTCREAGIQRVIVVVGHEAEAVEAAIGRDVEYVTQEQQLGTGHAVRCTEDLLAGFDGVLAVLPGDAPLVRPDSLACMLQECEQSACAASLLTARLDEPGMYGRILRDQNGRVAGIVEAKDASAEVIAIREICTSIYAFKAAHLFPALRELSPENRQNEYYLTDVIAILADKGMAIAATVTEDPQEVLGINTRIELAEAAAIMRHRILESHMLNGVTVIDPSATYVDVGVRIGQDTVLYPGTIVEGQSRVGSGCVVGPNARIVDCTIGDSVTIDNSVAVGSTVGDGTRVGPFSRLRPGSIIGERVIIGDFVEIKNSTVGAGVSLAHMTYIGDSEIGDGTNIGAGTITCNFDGRRKHRTVIGKGAFVGSHTTLNAPVTVGDGAFIGSGSVITKDVPADALAVGRAQQIIKEEWARRRREAAEDS